MQNFDIAQNALETSLNSAGSAMEEHAKWSESLEARLNKLKATWQSLSQSFLSSKFLKTALDGVVALVNGLNKLIDTFGTLPTLVTLFAGGMSLFKKGGFFKVVTDEATGFATGITTTFKRAAQSANEALSSINVKNGFSKTLNNEDIAALRNYQNAINRGVSQTNALNQCMGNASNTAKIFATNYQGGTNVVSAFVREQQAAQISTLAQNQSLGNAKILMREYQSGCKTTGMAQADFANAVAQTNPKLATAMTTTNNTTFGMIKYRASLVAGKVATFALKAATLALNMALTMGISLIVSGIVSAISKWINASENLAEQVEEVTSKFKEEHNELQKLKNDYDASNEDSMASKYAKLSKGVDKLGRNVSLTSEEYSEYQGIVNKIAEQIPSLVSGYDQQGNALLSCRGNVEQLTEAYEKLIHAQNQEILSSNSGDIEKNWNNVLEQANGYDFWENIGNAFAAIPAIFGADVSVFDMKTDTAKFMSEMLNSKSSKDEIKDALQKKGGNDVAEISQALSGAGYDVRFGSISSVSEVLADAIENEPEKIKNILDNYYAGFDDAVAEYKTKATALLSEAFNVRSSISGLNYGNISEELQAIAYQTVNSLDFDFLSNLHDQGKTIDQWVKEMLNELNSISKEDNTQIEAAFDLQTQFNGGEISYGDYVHGLENTGKLIDGLNLKDEVKSQIKLSLGLDEDGLIEEYESLVARLSDNTKYDFDPNIMPSDARKFLDGLSSEELSVAVDVITEMSDNGVKETIDDIQNAIDREMMLRGLSFDLNFEVESAGIEALNTAMSESVTASGLSSDSIAALKGRYADLEAQGYDLSAMFEETSHGIHLNRQELNKFEQELATQKLNEANGQLKEMQAAYDQLGEDIRNCADPVEKAKLFSDRQLLAQRISEAATLAAQYEGLTSAYNDWLAAEESGQERDMYEKVIEGFENIDDEISRGWIDDGTIEFMEMLTGRTDLASLSAEELKKVYKGLDEEIKNTGYSIRDFFTVDDEGNSTSTGVYNFLKAVETLETSDAFKNIEGIENLIQRDENGKIVAFDFQVAGGDKAIAEALGISEELVQIMLRAADDAGFVISMDGTYKQLADLQNEARAAANYLREIGMTNVEFDFNTSSIDSLNKQLEEAHKILDNKDFWNADGSFNFDAKGATEAMTIVSTLQAKLDSLTAEQYGIGLTVEDKEFEEPLENLQDYGRKIATLNQLKLNPKVNAEEIEKLEKELDDIAEYFANLDGDKKVEIGLEADDGVEEIKKKIESGEVKIPTVLDIQVNMDKNIERLADLAWLKSGLLSESEEETIKKKYNIEVEADDIDTSDVDEKVDDAVTVGEGSGVVTGVAKGGLKGIRKANIQIIAQTVGTKDVDNLSSKLEGLDDKTIEAIAKVLGQVDVDRLKNAMAMLEPKQIEAIAKAIGQGDVEGLKSAINQLSPKQVQAIAEALGYSDVNELNNAIDKLSPKTVKAIAEALGISDVNSLKGAINKLTNKNVKATATTSGKGAVDSLRSAIDNLKDKTVIITTIKKVAEAGGKKADQRTGKDPAGDGEVNGTAHVNGTAFADGTKGKAFKQGSWGTKNSGTALVGELGREVLIRNGKYYTIGDDGAEFIKYRKGDIILNHVQSEELFKNGKVTADGGRAKAFASGTAFSKGSGGGIEPEVKDKSAGSDKDKEFEDVVDWVEVILDRVERAIDKFDKQASNIYKSWSSRNKALSNEISKINEEISLQQKAYSRYMQEAGSVGLSSDWASKVRNGAIDISTITNEDLADKIKKYTEWYDKAIDCQKAIEELKETEASLYAQRVENAAKEYEGVLGVIEHEKNMLESYISQSEAQAWLVSGEYYKALASNEQNHISELEKQKAAMLGELEVAMNSGTIDKYSESWYALCNSIDEVTLAIAEGQTQLLEYRQTLQQLSWETFDLLQDKISTVTEETEFLIDLMGNKKLYDDKGQLTGEGSATMGLHGVAYNTYMYQADLVAKEAQRLKKELAKDPFDTELEARYREMMSLQRGYIANAEDEKDAIKSLVEDGIDKELEALQKLIDKKNERLQSERDLYNYQKKVKQQTSEIANLQKQLSSYQNDDSEEAKTKIQQIKVDLESAQQELQESEYDKYISSQEKLLDDLYLEYEEILNMRLDNLDALVESMIEEINADSSSIGETIREAAKDVGYTLSDSMQSIWDKSSVGTKDVITTYGDKFVKAQTTTNNALDAINKNLQNMINQLNSKAKSNTKSASTSSVAKSSTTKSAKPKTTSTKKSTSGGDGVPQIGDKVKFISGIYYYDSQGRKPLGSKYHGKEVYITNINKRKWASRPYHISTGKTLGNGDLGWLKLNQISGYATGKKNFGANDVAWTQEKGKEFIIRPSDGAILTPIAKNDSVLNANASNNIWDMANSPAEFIKDNLNLNATQVPNNSKVQSNYTQTIENVTFDFKNVKNYEEMLCALRDDKRFEKLITAMTIDRLAGGSSLAKSKSIR